MRFNLAPAFPLDGGRILRALLRTRWVLAHPGSDAHGLGCWLVGVFVLDAEPNELRVMAERDLVGDLRVGDLMTPPALPGPSCSMAGDWSR